MRINPIQAIVASVVILGAAGLSELLRPHELMAATSPAPNLETVIPKQFGQWHVVPNIGLVTPDGAANVVDPHDPASPIYSQEVARGYQDAEGNTVMFLVAYGPAQTYRLKSHFPEICYSAAGFRVSPKTAEQLKEPNLSPFPVIRLVAQKERRYEPITYWVKVGHQVANNIIDRQMAMMKYGLRGVIPDGALIRLSTVGLSASVSYRVQDQFIHDLLEALAPKDRKFFTG